MVSFEYELWITEYSCSMVDAAGVVGLVLAILNSKMLKEQISLKVHFTLRKSSIPVH